MTIQLHVAMSAVAMLAISGCKATLLPPDGRLSNVTDVFPGTDPARGLDSAPATSKKTATFEAAYADVFRAVVAAATQGQINVETESKSSGLILGARVAKMIPPTPCGEPYEEPLKYYYLIEIRERAAKVTEVVAALKVQGTCYSGHCVGDSEPCVAYSGLDPVRWTV